jgi:hypothetical protein
MRIPKGFTVGAVPYVIIEKKSLGKERYGVTYLDTAVMKLATHWKNAPRPETGVLGRHETLWHEITHCVLYDMGHVLWNDEAFVTAFSRRLAQVIETAEF